MPLLPLAIGSTTALGLGYFCADLYRNRRRLAEQPVPEADLTCYELGDIPNGQDLEVVGGAISRAGHGLAEASSDCASSGIGHCVEAIAQVIAHH
ncbi:hypothetical protein PGN35_010580 [Nodosilinea sp. PGN35]|uniref:hypothetical protein n=1 Tax=Nodosilinea sp. PGN35 TaxID=3020489 RepID=UPI0023B230EC|nr:hypothetical protein [Nodosilinea sp. TSF1-S3]MDF0366525.1 hypothetical protein [Nodosilinea sp. TSF1-S3]